MVQGVVFSGEASESKSDEGVRDKNPDGPPAQMGFLQSVNLKKTGSSEDPADTFDMGSYTKTCYSAEQQARLQIDAEGNRVRGTPLDGGDGAGIPVPDSRRMQVDEKAHDKMVMSLQVKVEVERHMQSLAATYFAFWHFWFLFLPSAVLTMASGVLAFLSTSDLIEEVDRTLLVAVVGCLALVATFLQALNDMLKYGSRKEMHRSAVLDLKAIYDALDFMQISRIGSTENHGNVKEFHRMYSQVQQGCKSAIPLRVVQTFSTIETRLLSQLPSNKDVDFKGKIGVNQIYLALCNEVYCAVAAYWLFPLRLPDPDRIMALALKRVRAQIAKDISPAEASKGLSIGQMVLLREKLPHH